MKKLLAIAVLATIISCNSSSNKETKKEENTPAIKPYALQTSLEQKKLKGNIKTMYTYYSENVYRDDKDIWRAKDSSKEVVIERFNTDGYLVESATTKSNGDVVEYTYNYIDKTHYTKYSNNIFNRPGIFKYHYFNDTSFEVKFYAIRNNDSLLSIHDTLIYSMDGNTHRKHAIIYFEGKIAQDEIYTAIDKTIKDTTILTDINGTDTTQSRIIVLQRDAKGNPTVELNIDNVGNRLFFYSYEYY